MEVRKEERVRCAIWFLIFLLLARIREDLGKNMKTMKRAQEKND